MENPNDYTYTVTEADCPVFAGEMVHPVCSTYALAREMEYAGRLFYLANRPPSTDAVGTSIKLEHHKPAFVGDYLNFDVTLLTWGEKGHICCDIKIYRAYDLIASGETHQKILNLSHLKKLFTPG